MLPRSWMEAYINFLLKFRWPVLIFVTAVSLFLGYNLKYMRVYTNFFDLYPPNHPYIQLYQKYRRMFGTANVLLMAIECKEGDIFNVDTINKINYATLQVVETAGVNPYQVRSLTHAKMKNIRITGAVITAYPIMYPGPPKTPDDVKSIKKAVYTNEGVHGFYVSQDNTATLITAGFWEEGVDFHNLYDRMLKIRQEVEKDGKHKVYIAGFPMLYSWIFSYKNYILAVIGITMVIIVAMLWFYFRTFTGVWVPLFSGSLSSLLALGLAGYFGFNLDPLVLVVLVLITARALSHSVQSMERYHEEYHRLQNKQDAIMASYLSLFSPAIVSIAADGFAILTLALAHIPLIQKLAYVSSFWVFTIFISVVTLHPIILYFIPPPPHDPKSGNRFSDHIYNGVNRAMVKISNGGYRYAVIGSFSVFLIIGMTYSRNLKIGDVSIGKALLYNTHDYNVSYDKVNQKFVGASQLVILAEGGKEGVIKDPQVLQTLEKFQRFMEQQKLVGGSLSITTPQHPGGGRSRRLPRQELAERHHHGFLQGLQPRDGGGVDRHGAAVHRKQPGGEYQLPPGGGIAGDPGGGERGGGVVVQVEPDPGDGDGVRLKHADLRLGGGGVDRDDPLDCRPTAVRGGDVCDGSGRQHQLVAGGGGGHRDRH